MGRRGGAFPSVRRLSLFTSLSGRTVQRSISQLEAIGCLRLERRAGCKTRYHLELSKLPDTPVTLSPHPRHSVTSDTASPPTEDPKTPDTVSRTPDRGSSPTEAPREAPKEAPIELGIDFHPKVIPGREGWYEVEVGSEVFLLDHKPRSSGAYAIAIALWHHIHRQSTGRRYGWVWRGPKSDGPRVKRWCEAVKAGRIRKDPNDGRKTIIADVEDPGPPLRALGEAMLAYHNAAKRGQAFPEGEPPTTRWFDDQISRWLQANPDDEPPTRRRGRQTLQEKLSGLIAVAHEDGIFDEEDQENGG